MRGPGRRKGSFTQATRLLRVLDYLKGHYFGVTLAGLAAQFRVTERQIRRDLDALDDAGYDVAWDLTPEGRTRVRLPTAKPRSLQLTLGERYALLAARRMFDVLDGTPLHDDIESVYSKVAASLSDDDRREQERFGERFLYLPAGGTKDYSAHEDVLNGLVTGVARRRRVRARYRKANGEVVAGLLEPWAMVVYKNGLYVIGSGLGPEGAPPQTEPHVHAVERFEEAEFQRGDAFEVPPDFRVKEFFEGAFGIFLGKKPERVVIEFAPQVRALVEARQWHPSQRLEPMRGGGVRLTMRVGNVTEVTTWVLGWGPLAVVREPESLRAEVARQLRAAIEQY